MRIADSSFLVALFLSGDRNYHDAEREAELSDPILIPSEVLSETLGVFQRRKGIDFARLIKQWVDRQPHFQIGFTERLHYDTASVIFAKSSERVDYVDSLVIAWSLARGAPVITYDEDLKKAVRRAQH